MEYNNILAGISDSKIMPFQTSQIQLLIPLNVAPIILLPWVKIFKGSLLHITKFRFL